MRRADRLFQIILLMRTGRVMTAARLAQELEISERTVYRDIQDLMACGVPIDGEAGVGYLMRKGFDLPPLMFAREELAALTLGARIVKSWADSDLSQAADRVLAKVEAVLPDALKPSLSEAALYAPIRLVTPQVAAAMGLLRQAIDAQYKVHFSYTRADGMTTVRTVWPLGLFFWGSVWTLGAWCELRQALRNFRLDRISDLKLAGESYTAMAGRTLTDLIRLETQEPQRKDNAAL